MSDAPDRTRSPLPEERNMATLAHILQVVGWWIAPLIILLIKRESRFVSFHALQALLLQILYALFMAVGMVLWFLFFFLSVARHPPAPGAPPVGVFVMFPLLWLGFMGAWTVMLVVAIVYAIKAGRGEWAEYPLLGRLSRRLLKIGPRWKRCFRSAGARILNNEARFPSRATRANDPIFGTYIR